MLSLAHAPVCRELAFIAAGEQLSAAPRKTTGQALAGHEGHVVTLRGQDGIRNSPILAALEQFIRHGLRGSGRYALDDDGAQDAWDAWTRQVGFRHQHGSLTRLLSIALRHLVADGEVYIQRVFVADLAGTQWSPNGLFLLARSRDEIDRGRGEHGHEYKAGAAYAGTWFRPPVSAAMNVIRDLTTVFVGSSNLTVLRWPATVDAVDGDMILAPALTPAKLVDELHRTELLAYQRSQAVMGIAITARPGVNAQMLNWGGEAELKTGDYKLNEIEPGRMGTAKGVDSVSWSPVRDATFDGSASASRATTAAGLSYQNVARVLDKTSFSAARMALGGDERVIQAMRADCDFTQGMVRIQRWFVAAELASRRDHSSASFEEIPLAPVLINAVDAARATDIAINGGWDTRKAAIRRSGRDPRKVEQEIAEEAATAVANAGGLSVVAA